MNKYLIGNAECGMRNAAVGRMPSAIELVFSCSLNFGDDGVKISFELAIVIRLSNRPRHLQDDARQIGHGADRTVRCLALIWVVSYVNPHCKVSLIGFVGRT